MNNKRILIALNLLPGVGPKMILRLLQLWPDLSEFIQQWQRFQKYLPSALVAGLGQLDWKQVDKECAWAQQEQCQILSIEDPEYPFLLLQIDNPPPILYLQGQVAVLAADKLAVVGSRHPSEYGVWVAKTWSQDLVRAGLCLVSGLAIGVDTLVHQAAVTEGQKTIAVLGSGLRRLYPSRNIGLARKIQEQGVLISEFPLFSPPNPGHFPRRNRIISGLALCTLVVEAAEKSGTMITAQYAVEQNREVFVVPGRVDCVRVQGGHRLIQQGARLAINIDDILVEYPEYQWVINKSLRGKNHERSAF